MLYNRMMMETLGLKLSAVSGLPGNNTTGLRLNCSQSVWCLTYPVATRSFVASLGPSRHPKDAESLISAKKHQPWGLPRMVRSAVSNNP